mgnify:CR=1 FL=1
MEPQAYTEIHLLEPTHWWYCGMRAITDSLLDGLLADRVDLTILDAGCGVGGHLSHLARYGQVIGCDLSPLALEYAAERHSGRILQATVEHLPYRTGSFDLVTSFDVLYALEVEDDLLALAEFARVLAPQAYLLLRLPALQPLAGQHDLIVHGARRYTRTEVEDKLRAVGLTPLRSTYANSLLFPVVYCIRWWQRWRKNSTKSTASDVRPTPSLLNSLLYRLLLSEAVWIKQGGDFPVGVSVIALAQKVEL